jgi:hypothetical protein
VLQNLEAQLYYFSSVAGQRNVEGFPDLTVLSPRLGLSSNRYLQMWGSLSAETP